MNNTKLKGEKMENPRYILQRSIDTYGESHIIDLFFEEAGELTKALLKARRYGTSPERTAAIVDEIADVSICLEYLKMIYQCDKAAADRIDYKLERTAQRCAEINARGHIGNRLYHAYVERKKSL